MKRKGHIINYILEHLNWNKVQGGILYISESGRKASYDMSSLRDNQSETNGKVILKSSKVYVSGADDSLSTTDLSRYTKSELQKMYFDGDITKSEYDEEICSREMEVQ